MIDINEENPLSRLYIVYTILVEIELEWNLSNELKMAYAIRNNKTNNSNPANGLL